MQYAPQVEIVRDLAAYDSLEEEWNALFAASPTAAPPLRLEWLQLWWNLYGGEYAARSGADTGLRLCPRPARRGAYRRLAAVRTAQQVRAAAPPSGFRGNRGG